MTLPVRLELDSSHQGDMVRDGAQFLTDDGLATAVLISLYTDRRAEPDDVLPGSDNDRRGWWADAYPDIPDDKIGSRLWLLGRGKATQDNVVAAKTYAEEALAWMVEDGAASLVVVTSERSGEMLALRIQIYEPGDTAPRYNELWRLRFDAL